MSTNKDVQNQYGNLEDHNYRSKVLQPTEETDSKISDESNSQIDNSFERLIKINLPNIAPKSAIINPKKLPDPKAQINALYDKYMGNNATIPIDINESITNELSMNILKMNDFNSYQLIHIWDTARHQVYGDLEFAFSRFRESESYRKYCQNQKSGLEIE